MTKEELGYETENHVCETCDFMNYKTVYIREVDREVDFAICEKVTMGSNRVSEEGTCKYHSGKNKGDKQ